MPLDAWLPVGLSLPDGAKVRLALHEGVDWQIFEAQGGGHALVVKESLHQHWVDSKLIEPGVFVPFSFGGDSLFEASCGSGHVLSPVTACKSPDSKNEALAFADALLATRQLDPESPFQDAIYVEKLSRLLPTYSLTARVPDDVVFGSWITGGVPVSVTAFRRLRTLVSWLGEQHLREVVQRAGFTAPATSGRTRAAEKVADAKAQPGEEPKEPVPETFSLAGRPELENFLIEHVIDIIENKERYKALGIEFPSAIILHGPPGCGKTFAIERLVEYLGWPSFQIEASSVASPFIHETSKKVAEVFDKAIKNSPSVLVIDEMEAFLADRQMGAGSSHHRVEEVAEFLRRIPEAIKNEVLIVAMTNRIEMIDPAILRRGRFDHVVKVDMASEDEVLSLLQNLVGLLPQEGEIDLSSLAKKLSGRPLSDVAFVVREGARIAARSGKDKLNQESLAKALETSPARDEDGGHRKIGFV
ncbi:MAG TPA: ATP-binding protein [Azonexus sp.]|jgi:cell division protease FtsH|uniref:ATP-binding protein n=1 Tax=Zoogloea sp. TaxID=49181 RepID=UPI002C873969|nr:ATP-binding protein [Azonexus sp.]